MPDSIGDAGSLDIVATSRSRGPGECLRHIPTDFSAVFWGPVERWGPWRLNLRNIRIHAAMLQPSGCVVLHLPTGRRTTIAKMNSRAAKTIPVPTGTLTERDVER